MKSHEAIYDVLFSQPDRWFAVKEMVTESGFSQTTVRRAFRQLEAAAMVNQRQLNGRTQYSLTLPSVVLPEPKKGWRRFRRRK